MITSLEGRKHWGRVTFRYVELSRWHRFGKDREVLFDRMIGITGFYWLALP